MPDRRSLSIDLAVLLVFAILPFMFYLNVLLIFSNAQLYLNPSGLVHDVSYLWNGQINLGGNIGWGMGGFFPMFSFFALFESLGLPLLLVDKFWLIFLIFGSGVSMYFLCSVTVQKAHRLSKVVSGLAYMYSLYVVVN